MSDRGKPEKARSRPGYLPADFLMLAYLGLSGVLLIFSPLTFPGRMTYTAVHFALLSVVILSRFVPIDGGALLGFLRRGYPLLALPLLYTSLRYLNRLATTDYFDGFIVNLEQAIFGCQPSQGFHLALPWPPLAEFLHLVYVGYLVLIPVVAIPLVLRRREDDLAVFTTSVMGTFLTCYTIFIFFPVRGPYHYFGPIDPAQQGWVFPQVAHWILNGGSSAGSAFPSSHVAVATCIWLVGRRLYPRWGWALLLVAGGILLATVYGGFHYALDALAGLGFGIAGGLAGPSFHGWILRRQRTSAGAPAVVEEERAAAS